MSKAEYSVLAFSVATKAIALRSVDSAELDPIFAAIEAHRKAFLDWGVGSDEDIDVPRQGGRAWLSVARHCGTLGYGNGYNARKISLARSM